MSTKDLKNPWDKFFSANWDWINCFWLGLYVVITIKLSRQKKQTINTPVLSHISTITQICKYCLKPNKIPHGMCYKLTSSNFNQDIKKNILRQHILTVLQSNSTLGKQNVRSAIDEVGQGHEYQCHDDTNWQCHSLKIERSIVILYLDFEV